MRNVRVKGYQGDLAYIARHVEQLLDSVQTKVMEIPIEKPLPQIATPALTRSGTLQGKVIRLGGRQDIVSVEIQDADGHIYLCRPRRDLARRLAHAMFDETIRVHGAGKWRHREAATIVEDFIDWAIRHTRLR